MTSILREDLFLKWKCFYLHFLRDLKILWKKISENPRIWEGAIRPYAVVDEQCDLLLQKFVYFFTLVYSRLTLLDPSIYEVMLYEIVKGRGVNSSRVESGLLARFARSSITINFSLLIFRFWRPKSSSARWRPVVETSKATSLMIA